MVKRIGITNYLGEYISYDIEGVDVENNNGLFITEIEGLGPPTANLIFTQLVNADGSLFNTGKIAERNIVIKARFINAKTIEEARLLAYRYFPLNKKLRFDVVTENRNVFIEGYVEKVEPNIFSDAEEVQISIICDNPYFNDYDLYKDIYFSTTEPMFEFVYENNYDGRLFSNRFVTEFGNKLVDESYHNITINYVGNYGDIDVGYEISIECTGDSGVGTVMNPTIKFLNTGEALTFDEEDLFVYTGKRALYGGDKIVLTMLRRQKTCFFVDASSGSYYNILNMVNKNFSWPKLSPGLNMFNLSATSGEDFLRGRVQYQILYIGV